MKYLFFYVLVTLFTTFAFAQKRPNVEDSNVAYTDLIYSDEINGLNVFASDTVNRIVQKKLEQSKKNIIDIHNDHPKVYFTNNKGDKYLKVWGGPDLGYGWFYSIGYTNNGKCTDCGVYLGKEHVPDYTVNNGISLGDNIKQVWKKAYLNYFRKFSFRGISYFYFEKGVSHEVPFTPNQIFYYKFDKNDKLIEIGFGYGMIGVNPMLQPE